MAPFVDAIREQVSLSDPHPTLHIYNTLTRRKEPLRTVKPGQVGIYLCGPTVYDKAHIGHMVGPVLFDCIKRYLTYCGYRVTWVVNITDVDDKLINKARQRGITMLDVAEENIADYHGNLTALGVDQIDHFPRATESIDEIVQLIQTLIERGFAYDAEGDVYFDVLRDPQYGKLSNRSVESMQGDGGDAVQRKRNAGDFALWKSAKPGEPAWESPWGPGRPGWHIECSAMSRAILGPSFDIHGGGLDLVFPHHENEIAQSECCHGAPMATYWAHNGLLRRDPSAGKIGGRAERDASADAGDVGGKMSRSKGAGGLAELIARQGGERIRFFLLRTHYRSTVLFSEEAIAEAGIGLDAFARLIKRYARVTGEDYYALTTPSLRTAGDAQAAELAGGGAPALVDAARHREKFLAAMDDDFNTGGAMGELFELAKLINKHCDQSQLEKGSGSDRGTVDRAAVDAFTRMMGLFKELTSVLGLFQRPVDAPTDDEQPLLKQAMELVLALRSEARATKKYSAADAIRNGLAELAIEVEDRAGGTDWSGGGVGTLDGVIQLLIRLRQQARADKDFAAADAVRDRLAAIGVSLEDRAGGTEWAPLR